MYLYIKMRKIQKHILVNMQNIKAYFLKYTKK